LSSLPDNQLSEEATVHPYAEAPEAKEPAAPEAPPVEAPRPVNWSSVKTVVKEVIETVVLTLVIFFLIQTVVRNFRVVGTSMEPNLHNGQYLIIDKLSYRFGKPQQGDVVVFEPPNRPGEDYVKRVIGLPGDLVEIRPGEVLVNGVPLVEPWVVRPGSYYMAPVRVGPDEYFVLGDNRNSSSDSHSWGDVPAGNIVGRALVCYWPPSEWGLVTRVAPTVSTTLYAWLSHVVP